MERIDDIGFKGLKLIQDPEFFCYGVDAVLLSDFAKRAKVKKGNAIDLGTNNGVIPIILSAKTEWNITGVEVQKEAFDLAKRNIELNDLEDRLSLINSDILNLELPKSSFDVVTTNPPYKEGGSGLKSDNDKKMIARHETTASLEDFIQISSNLLKPKGEFFMVHRPSRLVDIFYYLRKYGLEPKEIEFVSPKQNEEPNILLVHAIKGAGKELKILESIAVYNEDGSYTKDILKAYDKYGG